MAIGGGGYVFPRYIEQNWPQSRVDVVEIDPDVTKAAIEGFALPMDTTVNTFSMDARNYVDELLEKKKQGQYIPTYDFIYEDAFNDFSIPFQLVTKEFNDKISEILADDGAYMINLIDVFDSGLFLAAVVNTLGETFPYINIIAENVPGHMRSTFVLIAAKQPFDSKEIIAGYPIEINELWLLDDSDIEELKQKSENLTLTDNYAPVENLLAPVARNSSKELLADEYLERAKKARDQKDYRKSIKYFRKAIKEDPGLSIDAYNEIAVMQANMGNLTDAVESFKKAIQYNEKLGHKNNIASVHHSLGVVYQRLNQPDQANRNFLIAVEQFKEDLKDNPDFHLKWSRLGNTYTSIGRFEEATDAFRKAFSLEPTNKQYFDDLLKVLEYQKRYDEVIDLLKKQIDTMKQYNAPQDAIRLLQDRLDIVELKVSESRNQT